MVTGGWLNQTIAFAGKRLAVTTLRVYDDRPGNKGKNITLIGAISDEGLIAAMTFACALNTASFLVFIEKILLPQLWVGAIVAICCKSCESRARRARLSQLFSDYPIMFLHC